MKNIGSLISEASNQNHDTETLELIKFLESATEEEKLDFKIKSMNSKVGNENLEDGVMCQKCLNKGAIFYVRDGYESAVDCECMIERKIVRELKKSGLYHEFKTRRFDNFETTSKEQENLLQKAVNFTKDFKGNWFVVMGQSGAGKTHVCTAISNRLIKTGKKFKYMPFVRDINLITRGLKSFTSSIKEEAENLLETYKNIDILYIDDFLKVSGNNEVVFDLIDHRYSNNLTTIISTELLPGSVINYDEAVAGRILEKSKDYTVVISKDPNKNYRFKGIS